MRDPRRSGSLLALGHALAAELPPRPAEAVVAAEPRPMPVRAAAVEDTPVNVEMAEPSIETPSVASLIPEVADRAPEMIAVVTEPALVMAETPSIEPVTEQVETTRSGACDPTSEDFDHVFGSFGTEENTANPGLRSWLGKALARESERAASVKGHLDPSSQTAADRVVAEVPSTGSCPNTTVAASPPSKSSDDNRRHLPSPRREEPVSFDEVRSDIRDCMDVLRRLQEDRRARFGFRTVRDFSR